MNRRFTTPICCIRNQHPAAKSADAARPLGHRDSHAGTERRVLSTRMGRRNTDSGPAQKNQVSRGGAGTQGAGEGWGSLVSAPPREKVLVAAAEPALSVGERAALGNRCDFLRPASEIRNPQSATRGGTPDPGPEGTRSEGSLCFSGGVTTPRDTKVPSPTPLLVVATFVAGAVEDWRASDIRWSPPIAATSVWSFDNCAGSVSLALVCAGSLVTPLRTESIALLTNGRGTGDGGRVQKLSFRQTEGQKHQMEES
jgi:hypothetical protein